MNRGTVLGFHPDQFQTSPESVAEDWRNTRQTEKVLRTSLGQAKADTVAYREYETRSDGQATDWEDARTLVASLPSAADLYIRRPYQVRLHKAGHRSWSTCQVAFLAVLIVALVFFLVCPDRWLVIGSWTHHPPLAPDPIHLVMTTEKQA